jgi:hypothetical protein
LTAKRPVQQFVRRKLMSLLNQQSVDLVVDLKPSFSSRVKVPGMVIFIT